eukprot:TRINITY_DN966_c0_g1_i2.p1 TRINITY_DN966_c0_g1~~TRINITY_DN966_c0_g1_i2.p1  ORF type:complete len:328 (+),score=78.37 TRINITY_DN966_c0_g1_i2:142-984(+)
MRALPPWWILAGVKPDGPEIDMGSWRAISFTAEQQAMFCVNDKGEVQDDSKHQAALAELKKGGGAAPAKGAVGGGMRALPPWWILAGVKPDGPEIDMGSWRAISFTAEQQAKFYVNEKGEVQDDTKHKAALAELKKGDAAPAKGGVCGVSALPPWWLRAGVKPEGPEIDMGGWKAISFTAEQQAKFCVNEKGEVQDDTKHQAALAQVSKGGYTAPAKGNVAALPPWWIRAGVKPAGPEIDMGGWKGISFTEEQQATFGITATGDVLDEAKHKSAVDALKK